jgi:hypothetical protein
MNNHSYPVIPNEDDKRDLTVSNWATEGTTGWEATTNSSVDETSSIVIPETLHTAGPGPEVSNVPRLLGWRQKTFIMNYLVVLRMRDSPIRPYRTARLLRTCLRKQTLIHIIARSHSAIQRRSFRQATAITHKYCQKK